MESNIQENPSQENTSLNKFNTSLNFCDVCGTLYNYINKNNKLFLNCRNCKQQVESKNYVVSVNNYNQTLEKCHNTVGVAILNTSITIVFGFSILVLSNFIPTIYFGVFTGIAMLLAMISVLTLLPKLILIVKPFGND